MKRFAELYRRLDMATATTHKLAALKDYLVEAADDESQFGSAAWVIYFLAGGKPRQAVATRLLRQFALNSSGLPEWLLEECYQSVGDLAETLALLLPPPAREDDIPLDVWMNRLAGLRQESEAERLARLGAWLAAMPLDQRLAFFKLITGGLRVGVSRLNVVNAFSVVTGVDAAQIAQRMMGYTQSGRAPRAQDFAALIAKEDATGQRDVKPYPFFLAHPLQAPLDELAAMLGPPSDWLIEWKFDGIRAQFIRRGGEWRLWSRGEELLNESFPEFAVLADWIAPGAVLDGELVVVTPSAAGGDLSRLDDIAPFAHLQKRLGRKLLGSKLLRELPAVFITYDLLEFEGRDIRALPQFERRALLERYVAAVSLKAGAVGVSLPLRLSPALADDDWSALYKSRESARSIGAEGMMLKARLAAYGVGRRKGGPGGAHWWKWKLDPMSIDAVMIYAQCGHGRRSGVYSDYTFALWDGEGEKKVLVPFAKAYSGLTDEEMRAVDVIIRKTTVENYGPVRSLQPTMVFELGFEGISLSTRHKSGVAVRFPRMLKWRHDKKVEDADTLGNLKQLLKDGA